MDEAVHLQYVVARLQQSMEGFPYIGSLKYLARMRGIPAGDVRAPQPALGDEDARVLRERLDAMPEVRDWLGPVA